jgi:hypothetical protein
MTCRSILNIHLARMGLGGLFRDLLDGILKVDDVEKAAWIPGLLLISRFQSSNRAIPNPASPATA